MKKYGISLTEEEMQKLTAKCEMSDNELDAAAGGDCCVTKERDCEQDYHHHL